MNLHELEPEIQKAGSGEALRESEADGQDSLLPMFLESSDDVPDMAFVNQDIPLQHGFRGRTLLMEFQDILLVFQWYLRVRDDQGRNQGMGSSTVFAFHSLNHKGYERAEQLQTSFVVSIQDHAATMPATALKPLDLEAARHFIVGGL